MIGKEALKDWLDDSVTQAALRVVAERIAVARAQLQSKARGSSDPACRATADLIDELEQLKKRLIEGNFTDGRDGS